MQGVMQSLATLGIGVATFTVTIIIAFLVIGNTSDQIVTTQSVNESDSATMTEAYNATNSLGEATDTIPGWVPLIILVVIGGIVLAMVKGFGGRK